VVKGRLRSRWVTDMSYTPKLHFANFTLRFGDAAVLLDKFDEIVEPAFFDAPPRIYGDNEYYIFDPKLTELGEGDSAQPAIVGRFVRNSELRRSHVLSGEALVPAPEAMSSATGAVFALLLETHTLLYVAATPSAPTLQHFRATILYHVSTYWQKYVEMTARELVVASKREGSRRLTLAEARVQARRALPQPTLEILPLPSSTQIEDFLSQFAKISFVRFRVIDSNHSIDGMGLVRQLRATKRATQSKSVELIERQPKDIKALTTQISNATGEGNVEAMVSGKSEDGATISGSNDKFSYSSEFSLSKTPLETASKAANKLAELVADGVLRLAKNAKAVHDKVEEIRKRARNDDSL